MVISLRQSLTELKCTPDYVFVNQPTSCTVTVSDSGPGAVTTPNGTAVINYDYNSYSCGLAKGNGPLASCSLTITPGAGLVLTAYNVTADYSGDAFHRSSNGNGVSLKVEQRPISVGINCNPNPVVHGVSTSCIITVSDNGGVGSPITPTGTVSLQSNPTGAFGSTTCTLAPTGTLGEASCEISYVQNSAGTVSIYASYSGDFITLPTAAPRN